MQDQIKRMLQQAHDEAKPKFGMYDRYASRLVPTFEKILEDLGLRNHKIIPQRSRQRINSIAIMKPDYQIIPIPDLIDVDDTNWEHPVRIDETVKFFSSLQQQMA